MKDNSKSKNNNIVTLLKYSFNICFNILKLKMDFNKTEEKCEVFTPVFSTLWAHGTCFLLCGALSHDN